MENNIKVFKNDEFGQIRTLTKDNEVWFVGKDVANILGYQNGSRDINRHIDDEDRQTISLFDGIQNRNSIIINESGMYSLILGSQLPTAKKFKHWVTNEVLPSIRKHGAYMTDDILEKALTSPDFLIQLATNLKTERAARELAEKENKILTKENDALSSEIASWANDAIIVSLVRRYGGRTSGFAIAWKEFKACMLYKYSICIESRITHYMRKNNVKTRPKILSVLNESEMTKALKVAIVMCRSKNIDISDILGRCITEEEFNKIIEDTQEKVV